MNHTNCQFRDKHTVGGIVFYKHAFLVEISVADFSAPMYASLFKFCIHLDTVQMYCIRENQMANTCICFSIVLPLCSFYICHSCIMNTEISVKNFSGTAQLRKMTFSTNIGNEKLYCLRNNQPSPAYQPLYLSIFLSLCCVNFLKFYTNLHKEIP